MYGKKIFEACAQGGILKLSSRKQRRKYLLYFDQG